MTPWLRTTDLDSQHFILFKFNYIDTLSNSYLNFTKPMAHVCPYGPKLGKLQPTSHVKCDKLFCNKVLLEHSKDLAISKADFVYNRDYIIQDAQDIYFFFFCRIC